MNKQCKRHNRHLCKTLAISFSVATEYEISGQHSLSLLTLEYENIWYTHRRCLG